MKKIKQLSWKFLFEIREDIDGEGDFSDGKLCPGTKVLVFKKQKHVQLVFVLFVD